MPDTSDQDQFLPQLRTAIHDLRRFIEKFGKRVRFDPSHRVGREHWRARREGKVFPGYRFRGVALAKRLQARIDTLAALTEEARAAGIAPEVVEVLDDFATPSRSFARPEAIWRDESNAVGQIIIWEEQVPDLARAETLIDELYNVGTDGADVSEDPLAEWSESFSKAEIGRRLWPNSANMRARDLNGAGFQLRKITERKWQIRLDKLRPDQRKRLETLAPLSE